MVSPRRRSETMSEQVTSEQVWAAAVTIYATGRVTPAGAIEKAAELVEAYERHLSRQEAVQELRTRLRQTACTPAALPVVRP
jgi:hypothetical protein